MSTAKATRVGPSRLGTTTRQGDSGFAPYLTVRGDAYVLKLDHGDWRTKPGANVELGASVMRHVVVSARWDAVPKVGGIDLSGFSGLVAVKLF